MKQLSTFLLLLLPTFFLQPLAAQNIGGIVNIYTPVTAISGCANHVLEVGSAQGFAPGDKVLLIQMQGATIDLTNGPNFGNIISFNGVGEYEMNRIDNIVGNQIQLLFTSSSWFNVAGKLQLIRVPEYVDATVINTLTCQPWNGTTGGVLAIDVSGTLTLESNIDVSAKGFRGGVVVDANAAPYGQLGYVYAPDPIVSAQKGEGIAIIPIDKSYGRGKAASGGGGGNSHNGGGGGGGNLGTGGFGGLEYHNIPNMPTPGTNGIGGWGGTSGIKMGGGGGAGHTNDEHGSSGGNGGGIVMLIANTIISNSKNILADGESVVSLGTDRNDGQGGGGAGGSLQIQANQLVGNVTCSVKGGKGGDCLFYVQSQIIGPGGGGGGGFVGRNLAFPGMTMITSGGENGIANQNLSNGATKGGNGFTITGGSIVQATEPAEVVTSQTIALCPGETTSLDGETYTAPATVNLTLPGSNGDCDTLTTYELILKNQDSLFQTIALCPGETTSLGGETYTAPATVNLTLPGSNGDCDTLATYKLILKNQDSLSQTIALCPGETTSLGGQTYTAPETVNLTLPGSNGDCDTLATYELILKNQDSLSQTIALCPGETTSLGGQTYTAPATVNLTLPGSNGECDTLATYELILKNQDSFSQTIALCPSETTSLGGQTYTAPATVNLTLPGSNGDCDTLATYTLILLTQPTLSQTIEFCPGETVTLGGVDYTQPTTVTLTLPAVLGCDTIATYTLVSLTPAPSNVSITCPNSVSMVTGSGTGPFVVNYAMPTAASDCPCPGLDLSLSAGLPSGSLFPVATTQVCWQAADSCGQTASCCFQVTVREEAPCDIKTNGCMKYELLSITADAGQNRTYRIRVTNNCPNPMTYTAIQIPSGVTAMSPADNTIYTEPTSGREYLVRNPNFSPMYSVRFKSTTDSISGGQSDVFRYKLPAQAVPTYINIRSRLEPQVFYEAHLNTFNCPIGITPPGERPSEEREITFTLSPEIRLFPNPTSGLLFADLSDWAGEDLQFRIMDSRGQMVLQRSVVANVDVQSVELPEHLPNGLYILEITTEKGERQRAQFVRVRE